MKSDQNNKPEFFTKFCQAKYDSAPKKNVIILSLESSYNYKYFII